MSSSTRRLCAITTLLLVGAFVHVSDAADNSMCVADNTLTATTSTITALATFDLDVTANTLDIKIFTSDLVSATNVEIKDDTGATVDVLSTSFPLVDTASLTEAQIQKFVNGDLELYIEYTDSNDDIGCTIPVYDDLVATAYMVPSEAVPPSTVADTGLAYVYADPSYMGASSNPSTSDWASWEFVYYQTHTTGYTYGGWGEPGVSSGYINVIPMSSGSYYVVDDKVSNGVPEPYDSLTNGTLYLVTIKENGGNPNLYRGQFARLEERKANGAVCTFNSECATDACVDGYCCDTTCSGLCEACDVAGNLGTCTPIPDGTDPDNDCTAEATSTCGRDGECDGAGACRLYSAATVCLTDTCSNPNDFTPTSYCDGAGTCDTTTTDCAGGFICDSATACKTSCASDTDCAFSPSEYCDTSGGVCEAPRATGSTCIAGVQQCASGNCVDGYCCDTACNGTCEACNVAASEGTCTPIPDGTDPDNDCTAEATSTCGRDGECDGAGACRLYSAATVCLTDTCSNPNDFTPTSYCDGAGTCDTTTTDCAGGFICDSATACKTSCASDTDCAFSPSEYCDTSGGVCEAPRATGSTCIAGVQQCASGNCVDGYCCDTACNGTCEACNVAASEGTCSPVPDGTDPDADCAAEATSTCGRDGQCDGAGACRLYSPATLCYTATCQNTNDYTADTYCDGAGTCPTVTQACPGGYICAGPYGCRVNCTADAECAYYPATAYCNVVNNTCDGPLPNGSPCTGLDTCESGFCVDGYCCESACSGTCEYCSSAGLCTLVSGGTDPDSECTMEAASTCGQDGFCNGTAPACALYTTATECTAESCTGSSYTAASFCDGTGSCSTQSPTACPGNYVCDTDSCFTTCTSDAECTAAATCVVSTGQCVPLVPSPPPPPPPMTSSSSSTSSTTMMTTTTGAVTSSSPPVNSGGGGEQIDDGKPSGFLKEDNLGLGLSNTVYLGAGGGLLLLCCCSCIVIAVFCGCASCCGGGDDANGGLYSGKSVGYDYDDNGSSLFVDSSAGISGPMNVTSTYNVNNPGATTTVSSTAPPVEDDEDFQITFEDDRYGGDEGVDSYATGGGGGGGDDFYADYAGDPEGGVELGRYN